MATAKKPVTRPKGLSPEFERGRDFEQQETFIMLTQLLRLTDDEYVRSILSAWRIQLMEQLLANDFTIIIEDTYLVID